MTYIIVSMAYEDNSDKKKTSAKRWTEATVLGLLFLLFASPLMMKALDVGGEAIGMHLVSSAGCPTMGGLLLSAILFTLLMRALMSMGY